MPKKKSPLQHRPGYVMKKWLMFCSLWRNSSWRRRRWSTFCFLLGSVFTSSSTSRKNGKGCSNSVYPRSLLVCAASLFLSMALGLAGCGEEKVKDSTAPGQVSKLKVSMDWTINTAHTGLYVAKHKGFFQREGFDVEFLKGQFVAADRIVGSQQADVGLCGQKSVFMARKRGVPIRSIATLMQNNPNGITVAKKSSITQLKDLEGKKYGAYGGSLELAMLQSLMRQAGADPSKVTVVDAHDFSKSAAIHQGVIDAAWLYKGWDGIEGDVKNRPLRIFDIAELDPRLNVYATVIIANEGTTQKDPERLRKFLRAAGDGYRYAIAHPEEAADILMKENRMLDKAVVKASQHYMVSHYQANAPYWGFQDKKRWSDFKDYMVEKGLLDPSFDVEKAFTNDFLDRKGSFS
ncbi:ABC transporter substrate-binding protein [Pasteuria penetrans]|uniref:ABC transporter substrate-binding protein n=1 Tax=Pasteuria penetrans TaxID=86005 RepID=UPI000FA954F1|nr:ABC transporter substrate-binding protein [Pasteuria penetrans]